MTSGDMERLAEIERQARNADIGLRDALLQAFTLGIRAGREAEPAIVRIGQTHTPEVQT